MNKKEYAIKYAAAGLKIFPLHWITDNGKCSCGQVDCAPNSWGKHTIAKLAKNSHLDATSDVSKVTAWWSQYPNANIGLACEASGLMVVDVDLHDGNKNGFESIDDFETTFEDKITSTVIANTGGGGLHIYYKRPTEFSSIPAGLGKNYPGVDFKCKGYVVLEPSNHRKGECYKFQDESSFDNLLKGNVPPLARSIVEFIRKSQTVSYTPSRYAAPARFADDDDIEQMREALDNMSFWSLDDDERLKVGMGLQQALPGGAGKSLYFDWLSQNLGSKFSVKKSERRWRSFKYRSGGRTIASFYDVAMSCGFENKGKEGTYVIVNPDDFVFMEPTKVSDETLEGEDDDKNTIFVDLHIKPSMPLVTVEPSIMFIDSDAEPSPDEVVKKAVVEPKLFIPNVAGGSHMNLLQSELMRMSNQPDDPNLGMPTQQQWQEWNEKLSGNKVLCSLFQYQVENNTKFVPELALSFALGTIGSLLAGRFEHSMLTTNLYIMVISKTTAGKSQTMAMVSNIFDYCNESQRIGPKTIVSDKGFYNDLQVDKARYFQLDEIGELFSVIFGPRSNPSQQAIKLALLDGFTGFSNKHNKTASKADAKTNPIADLGQICPSILGVTNESKIFDSLTGKDIIDGMLNRFFVTYNSDKDIVGKMPMRTDIPAIFKRWFMQIRQRWNAAGGIMPVAGSDTLTSMGLTSEASVMIKAVKNIETQKVASDEKYGLVWGRLTEIVIRISMIFELTERPFSGNIEASSITAAYNLACWAVGQTEAISRDKISDSEEESIKKEVLAKIAECENGIFFHELTEKTRLAANTKIRGTIINALKDEQKIKEFKFQPKGTRGRPKKIYFTIKNLNKLPRDMKENLKEIGLEI